ncbi:LOW QUALITY PROTEIN: promotilin [Nannospalax galili]|uniref:LOW QUALITY PROTEIN: promotilin n=1 Tax=Nannospalax galili TaxID=1026970 RepID=UPI00111C4A3C|nr:LOW QUALITY PROTEIN: promotilin [Nannospalax galili]
MVSPWDPRTVSGRAVGSLLVVRTAAMLASQVEAFMPIFTYSEVQRMQEREQSKRQKSLSPPEEAKGVNPLDPQETTEEEGVKPIKLTAPRKIEERLTSRQLEKYPAALEGLLREALPLDWLAK